MPDPIPAVAASAAAAPTPPPATPTPATPAPTRTNREIAGNLANLLTQRTPPLTEPEKKPAPVAPKTDTPKPKADKPIKVVKAAPEPKPEDKPPPVPKREVKTAEPTPAVVVAPKPESDEDFEKSLMEEERAQLDDARAAEKYLPDKYKGHAGKLRSFLKENAAKDALVQKGELEAEDYKTWYEANRPKIGPLDFRTIERARVKEEVTQDFAPKIEAEQHARWVDTESPNIRRKGDDVYRKLTNSALPDELMAEITERTKGVTDQGEFLKRVEEVQKDYAMEFEVADTVIKQATADIEEFHRLVTINPNTGKPLKPRNGDVNSEEGRWHAQIAKMAHDLIDDFKANGGAELRRDGKWFATWREWNDMTPEQQAAWWTFSNDEVAARAMSKVKGVISAEVKRRNDYLAARGFTRQKPNGAAVVVPPPVPSSGAPAAPRPSPPPTGGGQQPVSAGARLAAKLL